MTDVLLDALSTVKRVVTYERVSSDEQRERQTILLQQAALERELEAHPECELVDRYIDDGVSGTVLFAKRPAGGRLLRDAERGLFDEVWTYDNSRLGREDVDPLLVRRQLDHLGIRLRSLHEGYADTLLFPITIAVASEERKTFLRRSADGMNEAARQGRYCGGIVPYGYRAEGHKHTSHLVPAEEKQLGSPMSEAEVVRHIYRRLAADGFSCRRVADELNILGVPTKYTLEGRGVRGKRTQGRWGPGRVGNMVRNPIYRGEQHYGRRSKRERRIISAQVVPLVSPELWQAAQETLARNRLIVKNSERSYLLRGLIRCGGCGRTYCGSLNRGRVWYRCDGRNSRSDLVGPRCSAKAIKAEYLEPAVWSDIERFLYNPADLLDELERELAEDPRRRALEHERQLLEAALGQQELQRSRLLDLYQRGVIAPEELDERLHPILVRKAELDKRMAGLTEHEQGDDAPPPVDLLPELRRLLENGLTDAQRQEIARLLVRRINVRQSTTLEGVKAQRAVISYRFPAVGSSRTDTGSWRPPA
jgi:site-specific DNA recombinase